MKLQSATDSFNSNLPHEIGGIQFLGLQSFLRIVCYIVWRVLSMQRLITRGTGSHEVGVRGEVILFVLSYFIQL